MSGTPPVQVYLIPYGFPEAPLGGKSKILVQNVTEKLM